MELAFGVGVKVIDGYVNVGVSDGIVCLKRNIGFFLLVHLVPLWRGLWLEREAGGDKGEDEGCEFEC